MVAATLPGTLTAPASLDQSANTNGSEPPIRRFKAADLPLPSATRAAIDSLAHSFKKKGGYDAIRKEVWQKFEASVCCETKVASV